MMCPKDNYKQIELKGPEDVDPWGIIVLLGPTMWKPISMLYKYVEVELEVSHPATWENLAAVSESI